MLTKLAFKNVRKSIKDYSIYFFTLVLGVCIFYMFNSIYAQKEIMEATKTMSESMKIIETALSYISIFVAIILGFLVVYANNFFIKRRKKELGIYMTLGMDKSKISQILILETLAIGIIALVVGLVAGVFLSQFMSVFTAKIFEANMTKFKFIFAYQAALKSIMYFGIIFVVVIIFNTFSISRFKLIDLLHGSRKNEKQKLRSLKLAVVIFIISVVFLGAAYTIILKNGIFNINKNFGTSILCGTIGTILFFFSLSGMLTSLIKSNKKIYFKNLNMFVLRQLNSKINTNFISISVVCIVLLLNIGIFSTGYSVQNYLSKSLTDMYDYTFYNYQYQSDKNTIEEAKPIFENMPTKLKSKEYIKDYVEYKQYNFVNDVNDNSRGTITIIALSDYNKTLKLMGEKEYKLDNDKYLININMENYKKNIQDYIDGKEKLIIQNKELKPIVNKKSVVTDNARTPIIVVVNDEYVKNLKIDRVVLNIMNKNKETAEKYYDLVEKYKQDKTMKNMAFHLDASAIEAKLQSVTTKAIVAFLGIYLGIVFMITCAAILAIQQLTEASDNKHRYELLMKLGADKKMINKALFNQILCYFLAPLGLAIVHSIVGLTAVNQMISEVAHLNLAQNILTTSLFIGGIYGIYFIITYISSKAIINKNN